MESNNYKKIVFIDDDSELVQVYKSILGKKNLDEYLIYFDNAHDSIEYLNSIESHADVPDYILLDLYMPEMSGFQFLKHFERFSDFKKSIEIYVCTASKKTDDRNKVMNYPFVSAYLEKPLPADFLELLITDNA